MLLGVAMKTLRIGLAIGLAAAAFVSARPAYGIPAFARKYGLKCTACHEAWPMLNVVGRAFRDNGYRFNNGKDDAITTDPSYWPIFAWVESNYQYTYSKSEKHTLSNTGQVNTPFAILGTMGSLSQHISFNVRLVEFGGAVSLDDAFIRVNRVFDTDALNVRIGQLDFDLPIVTAGERDFTPSFPGTQRSLSYGVPGSHQLDLLAVPTGIELSGHDRGSINRYSVMVYNNGGIASHQLFSTPSVYGHVSHLFQLPDGFVRDVELGAFGTYATQSVGPDSAALKPQMRYGGSLDAWLASDALPLHLEAIAFQGRDNRALIGGATQDALFDGGLVQIDYVPALPVELFARASLIRNVSQALPTRTGSFADQTVYLFGIQHTVEFTSRFEWGWQVYYSWEQDRLLAPDGTNQTLHSVWAGLLLAF